MDTNDPDRQTTLRQLSNAWADTLHHHDTRFETDTIHAYWHEYATHGNTINQAFLCYALNGARITSTQLLDLTLHPTCPPSPNIKHDTYRRVWYDIRYMPNMGVTMRALWAYKRILDAAPDDKARADTLASIAYLTLWRGDKQDARRYVGEALRLDPGNRTARLLDNRARNGLKPAWVDVAGTFFNTLGDHSGL